MRNTCKYELKPTLCDRCVPTSLRRFGPSAPIKHKKRYTGKRNREREREREEGRERERDREERENTCVRRGSSSKKESVTGSMISFASSENMCKNKAKVRFKG